MSYISKVKLPNNSEYLLKDSTAHYYGLCETEAATSTKTTTIANFILETGTKIILTFTYTNSAASPTLSINNEEAIPFILINNNTELWNAGETCEFIYNGIGWNLINYDKIEVIRL